MKLKKEDRVMARIGIVFLLFVFANWAYADSTRIVNYHEVEQTPQVINKTYGVSGNALAIAVAQHQFDWSTDDLQGSVGTGIYEGERAMSWALAKRFKKTLVTGSVSAQGSTFGVGAGLNWRF